jgi:hypothetical protein
MNAPPGLLVNQVRTPNHWIAFRPIGSIGGKKSSAQQSVTTPNSPAPQSNRDAIGARIRIKAGTRILVEEVRSGSSFISNNDMRVHFGLGSASNMDWVEVRWPSGLLEKFDNLAVDTFRTLKESTGTSVPNQEELARRCWRVKVLIRNKLREVHGILSTRSASSSRTPDRLHSLASAW